MDDGDKHKGLKGKISVEERKRPISLIESISFSLSLLTKLDVGRSMLKDILLKDHTALAISRLDLRFQKEYYSGIIFAFRSHEF